MKSILKTLPEVQKRSRVRWVGFQHIELMRDKLTKRFSECAKKDLDGICFIADYNNQTFPRAYKGIPESTLVMFEHKRGSWRVVKIWRGETRKDMFNLSCGRELLMNALVNGNISF